MNAILWRFPAWVHGLVYLLTGRRLAWPCGGERRWLSRAEYWKAVIAGKVVEQE